VVQSQTKSETKTETVSPAPTAEVKKAEPKPLFGQRKLKEAEFIYKEPNEKSQKTWQFKKGTVVNVVQPGSEGWVKVIDSGSRGGWVRLEALEEVN
jgi:SH3-like domain-containing protein